MLEGLTLETTSETSRDFTFFFHISCIEHLSSSIRNQQHPKLPQQQPISHPKLSSTLHSPPPEPRQLSPWLHQKSLLIASESIPLKPQTLSAIVDCPETAFLVL
jgi:hypothetical protein